MSHDEEKKRIPTGEEDGEPRKTRLTAKAVIASAVSAFLLAIGVAWARGLFEQTDFSGVCKALSDGFLVPGAVFMGVAGLTWMATYGMYDIMGFGCSSLFGRFIPFDSVYKRKESFYDYKTKRDERGRVWKIDMLLVGGICFALSILFALLY